VTGKAVVCTTLGYRKQQFIGVIQSRRLRPNRLRSCRSKACKIIAPYAFIVTAGKCFSKNSLDNNESDFGMVEFVLLKSRVRMEMPRQIAEMKVPV
jgi:hypothetical protein